jgi:NRPS condensation-like uncharacterized protein
MDHRIVSPIEMYSVARNNIDFYKTIVFYVRFQASLFSLSEWKLRIEKALRLTIEAQPRLRLQVDLSRKQPYFIILPMNIFDTLPIRIIERTNDDEEEEFLDKIVEDESNTGFAYNQSSPLWRVILIVSSESNIFDMIVTFNHAICDGMSGMGFFTSFVECLLEKSTSTFPLINDRPSYELIPSKLPPLSSFLLQIIEKILLPNFLSQYFFPKTYWTGNIQLIGNEPFQTRLISFKLSNKLLDLLHKKCQNEQTTIHTAILSSLLLSITEIFGKKNMEFLCGTAVNIRRYCQPIISNQQMGVFISNANSYHYIPYRENLEDLFWPLARQIKEQINQEIDQSILPLIQSLKFVSNWNNYLKNQRKILPNGYQNSVDISNILQWSFESHHPSWKILHGGFTQSANIVGSAFTVSVVGVFHGVSTTKSTSISKSHETFRVCRA